METVSLHTTWGESDAEFFEELRRQTHVGSGWGSIHAIDEPDDADYHVVFNRLRSDLDETHQLVFFAEPPISEAYQPPDEDRVAGTYPLSRHHKPQRWWVGKSYDDLVAMNPPEKPRSLSWITTDKGRDVGRLGRTSTRLARRLGVPERWRRSIPLVGGGPTDGHVLRVELLDRLIASDSEVVDIYGRGDFEGEWYRGTVEDKWGGLRDYRYSLAIENYRGSNYFSEKLTDALLAWCLPIYWGCTNLDEYLLGDNYVEIDVAGDGAVEQIQQVVESDLYDERIDAIAEARRRILDEYQLWPTVEAAVERPETPSASGP